MHFLQEKVFLGEKNVKRLYVSEHFLSDIEQSSSLLI